MPCLDTTLFLDLAGRGGRERRAAASSALRQFAMSPEALTTTRFNVAELYVGTERAPDRRREEARVKALIEGIIILEFDDDAARTFAKITAHLQEIGRPSSDLDVRIASVALVYGQSFVTRNPRHFSNIPGLTVVTY